jgi:predicted transcriptional regulator
MSRILNLELSDEVYAALQRLAEGAGTSPAQLAARSLERQFGRANGQLPRQPRTAAEQEAARRRFEGHFGEIALGYPTGADNDSIDTDLAHEYADTHP